MILDTAEAMYRYFLTEVRKERTIVITPSDWSTFINTVALDWEKTKLPDVEFNQKRIDDLMSVKVLTDGVSYPLIEKTITNVFTIPLSSGTYPNYMHGLSVSFLEVDESVPTTIIREQVGKIQRSDKRGASKNNPYRQADDSHFVYFEQRKGKIYCYPETGVFNRLVLEYYSYADEIIFSSTEDEVGSFSPSQNKEIVDMAVTRYLERVSDQRIQTQPQVSASVPK